MKIAENLVWYTRKIESNIGVQWGQENPNPRVHRFSGKRGLPRQTRLAECRVSHYNGGPEGWDFLVDIEHYNQIDYFSHISSRNSFTNDPSLFMEVSNVNERNKKI